MVKSNTNIETVSGKLRFSALRTKESRRIRRIGIHHTYVRINESKDTCTMAPLLSRIYYLFARITTYQLSFTYTGMMMVGNTYITQQLSICLS